MLRRITQLVVLIGVVVFAVALFSGDEDGNGGLAPQAPEPQQDASIPSVAAVQGTLVARGYDPGPVDGVYGAKTRQAIEHYQRDEGLAVDGQITTSLLNRIQEGIERVATTSDFFARPGAVCSSLDDLGLVTSGWKPSNALPGEWVCLTPYLEFGPRGPGGLASNIAFYGAGTRAERAHDYRVVVNINNPITRSEAFERLAAATEVLFGLAGAPFPTGLADALRTQRPVATSTVFGTAELVYEPSRIDTYKVVLTDQRYLDEKATARADVASDFHRCRQVTARAVGYDLSAVTGDGDPIQEHGYKSFMLGGMGRDLFFCEVHDNGTWRVKAAIGGKYPMRYIAEGRF